MSLDGDLLGQAELLAGLDPTRPKQVNLRRAVSAAYYALFHLLVRESSTRLVTGRELRALTARAFAHTGMKQACQDFIKRLLPPRLQEFHRGEAPPDLRQVAGAFIQLQQARHDADYNVVQSFDRDEARRLIQHASEAFEAWARVKDQPIAQVFLVALLIGDRWNRG